MLKQTRLPKGPQAQSGAPVHKGPEWMNIPSGKYAVGYGRPPEHSKWKKGQCGNPAQIRKRTAKPVVAMIDEFFCQRACRRRERYTEAAQCFGDHSAAASQQGNLRKHSRS